MNKVTYLLICLIEECAEVIQRACKALRFGLNEIQEGQELDNKVRLSGELTDLVTIVELLREERAVHSVYDSPKIIAKKNRVEKYMELSREQGILDET